MKRNFIYLAALTLLAVLLVVFTAQRGDSPQPSTEGDLLLPAIASRINAVDSVEIVTKGNRTVVRLHRVDDHWLVEEMHDYRADWPKLRSLLADLAQARVIETKTDNSSYYARLGVEDIAAEDAAGKLVKLGIGDQSTAVVVGKSAQGRTGQYARLQDQAGSVLLDREFNIPDQALDWVDRKIIDINSAEVAEVEVIHPDGQRVLVTRVSADQANFELAGIPEGREIKSNWVVNSLASTLSLLEMKSVRPAAGDIDWSTAVRMRLLTFSGMEIMAEFLKQDDDYLMRLSAAHPAAVVATNKAENAEAEESTDGNVEQQAMADVARAVDDINQRVSGWVYSIENYKFDAVVKKPEDLLKPLEDK
ncbi:MAG: DUF4340 domain-containing protein [Xanthomonadales bacterium]|nr:DUF4340 domain-containing protein [Xanthomonadales bacterium]